MMASFSAFGGDLPSIALIVIHRLEGSVLWSSVSLCSQFVIASKFIWNQRVCSIPTPCKVFVLKII